MKKHSPIRKIIVSTIFFVVLVVVAPITILYSLGYRFNKETKVFVHSGSIVLKTTPFTVNIALSGKEIPQKSIDLINRSYNINGLAPGSYEVEISANGYNSWKKQTEVHPGIATEFWNVVLVPQDLERKTLLEEKLLKYSFSPNKKKIAYFEQNKDSLSLFVQEDSQSTLVYQEPLNQKFIPGAGELKWSADGQSLLFSLKKGNDEEILLTNAERNYSEIIPIGEIFQRSVPSQLPDREATVQKNKNIKTQQLSVSLYSWNDQNNIYFVLGENIFAEPADEIFSWWRGTILNNGNANNNNNNATPSLGEIRRQYAKNPEKLTLTGDNVPQKIVEKADGFTFCGKYVCSVNAAEKLLTVVSQEGELQTKVPFPEKYEGTKKYQVFAYSDELVALLDENGNLFIWDVLGNEKEGAEGMKFIFSGVKEVYFSDDGKKLLFATKNEVYVYSVREWEVQPKHLAGELELVWAQSEDFENVQWYLDYQNILVVNKDRVIMVELDDRGGRNIAVFLEGQEIGNAGYDTLERKFWFTEKGENDMLKLQEVAFPQTAGIFSGLMNNSSN